MRALQYDYLRRTVVIAPRVIATATPLSGVVDLLGASNVEFEMMSGDVDVTLSAALTFNLEHGDAADYSDMTPVPESLLLGTEAALDINAASLVRRIGYKVAAGKRYVRVNCVPSSETVANLTPTVARGIDPQSWAGLSSLTSLTIDTQGFAYVSALCAFGLNTFTGGKVAGNVRLNWSDDDVTYAAVPAPFFTGDAITVSGAIPSNTVGHLYYLAGKTGAKRYLQAFAEVFGVSGGSLPISVAFELLNIPLPTAFGVMALIRDHHSHQTEEQ